MDTSERMTTNEQTGGKKGVKEARYDLIPPDPLNLIARVYGKGCEKYAARNWEKGYEWSKSFGAAMRHMWAFWGGEEIDPESGLPHLAHAAWHCLALMQFCETHRELDDRSDLVKNWDWFTVNSSDLPTTTANPCNPVNLCEGDPERTEAVQYIDYVPNQRVRHEKWGVGRIRNFSSDRSMAVVEFENPERTVGVPISSNRMEAIPEPTFYIAGPMRGYKDYNFPAFDAARDFGRKLGYNTISPADLDRDSDVHENTPEEKVNSAEMVREFVRRDVDALLSLRAENGDGIALLPGWGQSKGACAEVAVARWLGLRVVDAETFDPIPYSSITSHARGLSDFFAMFKLFVSGKEDA